MSFLLSRSPLLTITTGKDSGFSDMIFFKYLTFQCNLNCQILILHENYNQFVNIQSYSITQDGFTNMRWFNEMCCVVYKSYHIIISISKFIVFPLLFFKCNNQNYLSNFSKTTRWLNYSKTLIWFNYEKNHMVNNIIFKKKNF